jgi:hypothetical protein
MLVVPLISSPNACSDYALSSESYSKPLTNRTIVRYNYNRTLVWEAMIWLKQKKSICWNFKENLVPKQLVKDIYLKKDGRMVLDVQNVITVSIITLAPVIFMNVKNVPIKPQSQPELSCIEAN